MSAGLPPSSAEEAADSDAMLVERTLAGDQKAFELLVIKYQRRIQRLIGRMVRDVDLVEDIAQDTFIRAYLALAQFRGEAQFYTWLYRIAVNTAKKALMDLKRNPTVSENAYKSDDDDETSRVENELTSSGQQGNRRDHQCRHASPAGRVARSDHPAGNRRIELRGDIGSHELSHWYGAFPHFQSP